jgi:opacity protein-like surface antigen
MSEDKNFDDYIKQEFNNYSPDVAPHIWDKIVAERKKRRPVGFWFNVFSSTNLIWLVALILAGSVGTALIISHSSIKASINEVVSNNNPAATNNTNVANINSSPNKDDNNIGVNKEVSSSSKSENKKPDLIQPSLQSNSNNNNNVKDVATTQNTSISKKNIILNTDETFDAKSINGKISSNNINHKAGKINKQTTGLNNDINSVDNETSVLPGISAKSFIGNNSVNKNYFAEPLSDKVDKLSLNGTIAQSSLRQKNIPAINLPECPTMEKDAAGNKKYIEVYLAPDYAVRAITDTGNSVYLQQRKQTTSVTSAFSAGIRYTKVFNNAMSLRIGLNYSQINEKFYYVQGNIVQVTYTIDPVTGDTTGSYTVRGTRYKTTYNHYHSFDIPLTVGYELGNGRFHANINAGVIANIYSWQQGDELDTNLQPVSITTGKGSSLYMFRTNIGLGLTGGASVYYKLTDQIHLLAEPYIRYNFQPMSNDNLTLRQKYTTVGLRIGLRFDLPNPGSIIKR